MTTTVQERVLAATLESPMKLITRDFMHDPYPILRLIQEISPAVPVVVNGFRMWVVTRYDDVIRILDEPGLGKDLVGRARQVLQQSVVRPERRPRFPPQSRRGVLDRDGEDHRRLRTVLGPMFSPRRLAEYGRLFERTAGELVTRFQENETIDAVGQFARRLSATFAGELLGIPEEERDGFPIWETEMLTAPTIERIEAAAQHLYDFSLKMIDVKRANPGDDLFTWLLRMHDIDGSIDGDELASTIIMLIVAASEPAAAIGNALLLLLSHPDQLAKARACDYAGCVDEVMRFESPFRMLPPRFLDQPLRFGDLTIPSGELLLLSLAAANRDPKRFPDPDIFDVTRSTKGHLGFGYGPHRCIGAQLGRMATEIGIRSLLNRFPHSELAIPAEQADWRLGTYMRRLENLPVTLG
ncbi:cytochrome P450 [Actinoallomurus spadix]|uniref:Cytochrome P450 n=1 Tax=Actinoallomurus spadix TaxID=79912 RepID=A0ABN0WTR0_9ACTN|nr:cytochrome P450 [Actinoallomurus spadix]MCO5986399.1 cytochrome P450 [Actinoallomurus spadix]